jgi:hypothetical protein
MITGDRRHTNKIKSRITMAKSRVQQHEEELLHQQIGLQFKEENNKMLCLEHSFLWLKLGQLRK